MPGYNAPYASAAPMMGGKPQQGELRIKVVQANMYRDTDWLKKMDPCVVLEFHGHQFRTRILKNARKHPIWNEEFTIHVSSMNDESRLKVMDQDFGPDDVVVVANIKVSSLCFNNGLKDWIKQLEEAAILQITIKDNHTIIERETAKLINNE